MSDNLKVRYNQSIALSFDLTPTTSEAKNIVGSTTMIFCLIAFCNAELIVKAVQEPVDALAAAL